MIAYNDSLTPFQHQLSFPGEMTRAADVSLSIFELREALLVVSSSKSVHTIVLLGAFVHELKGWHEGLEIYFQLK